jgi:hypothetical protein
MPAMGFTTIKKRLRMLHSERLVRGRTIATRLEVALEAPFHIYRNRVGRSVAYSAPEYLAVSG